MKVVFKKQKKGFYVKLEIPISTGAGGLCYLCLQKCPGIPPKKNCFISRDMWPLTSSLTTRQVNDLLVSRTDGKQQKQQEPF